MSKLSRESLFFLDLLAKIHDHRVPFLLGIRIIEPVSNIQKIRLKMTKPFVPSENTLPIRSTIL